MKKQTLLAAMLLSALGAAQAQSSVTLFGVLDTGLYRKQLAGETARMTQSSGGMTTSYFGVRGNEDLGNGLKALFMLTGFLNLDTGVSGRFANDPMWSRSAWVGLGGDSVGTLRVGRQVTLGNQNLQRYSAFNDSTTFGPSAMHTYINSAAQPMMTGRGVTDTGWSNALSYTLPTLGGWTVAGMASIGEATTAGNRQALSAYYQSSGPWSGGIVVEQIDRMDLNFAKPPANVPMSRARGLNAGMSYDFKAVKLFGQVIRDELDGRTSHVVLKTLQISASVPIKTHSLLLAWGQTKKDQRATADEKRDTISVAYLHTLSKRTDLYAVGMRDRVTNTASGTGYGVGVRHRF